MGNWVCKSRRIKILFLGLEGVGKTSLLYHLKLGEVIKPHSTIGHNVENIDIDGIEVNLWDVTSRCKARALWKHYYLGTDGFVFIIDSACEEYELKEAEYEFHGVLNEDKNRDAVFMVIANKQDLPGARSAQELEDFFLKRISVHGPNTVLVVPCNALDLKQVNQIFTFLTYLICLNQAGKLKRGFITLKEQKEIQDKNKESTLKSLLKNPADYLKSLF